MIAYIYAVIAYIKWVIAIFAFFGKLKWPSEFAVKENICRGKGNNVSVQLSWGYTVQQFYNPEMACSQPLQCQPQEKWEMESLKFSKLPQRFFCFKIFIKV